MAKSTFIKVDRNILNWRWYTDANTLRVFLHLLLTANIAPQEIGTQTIERGEVATTYESIAKSLRISKSQTRTAIEHLILTREIALKKSPKMLIVSILNYDEYQANRTQNRTQIALKSHSNRTQIAPLQEYKESKEFKNNKENKENIIKEKRERNESNPFLRIALSEGEDNE